MKKYALATIGVAALTLTAAIVIPTILQSVRGNMAVTNYLFGLFVGCVTAAVVIVTLERVMN